MLMMPVLQLHNASSGMFDFSQGGSSILALKSRRHLHDIYVVQVWSTCLNNIV